MHILRPKKLDNHQNCWKSHVAIHFNFLKGSTKGKAWKKIILSFCFYGIYDGHITVTNYGNMGINGKQKDFTFVLPFRR